MYIYIYIYIPTELFFYSTRCYTDMKFPRVPLYLTIAARNTVGFIPFQNVSVVYEIRIPGFELGSKWPFPMLVTVTSRMRPHTHTHTLSLSLSLSLSFNIYNVSLSG